MYVERFENLLQELTEEGAKALAIVLKAAVKDRHQELLDDLFEANEQDFEKYEGLELMVDMLETEVLGDE